MRFKALLFTAALLAPAFASSAAEPSGASYVVSMILRDGNRQVAAPRLTVLAGRPASIEIDGLDGDRYRMRFTLSQQGGQSLAFRSTMSVDRPSGAHREAEPALVLALGTPAAIEFGAEGPAEQPLRISLDVQPVAATPQ